MNLDASWLALFGVFFGRNLRGIVFQLGSLGVSIMYASRAGMMLCVLSLLYVYIVRPRDVGLFKKLGLVCLVGLAMVGALWFSGSTILDRFLSIGDEPGSLGRLEMWQYVPVAFLDTPVIGCGAGNAMQHIMILSGEYFWEGNVHNYPMQVLLDFGIVGLVVFTILVVSVIKNFVGGRLQNRFAAYIVCWLLGSFLQFRGADAMLAFFVAGYLATCKMDMWLNSCTKKLPGGGYPRRRMALPLYLIFAFSTQLALSSVSLAGTLYIEDRNKFRLVAVAFALFFASFFYIGYAMNGVNEIAFCTSKVLGL